MKPKAKISNVTFTATCGGTIEFATGICIDHPNVGRNLICRGQVLYTSMITAKHANGDFETENTYYEVVK